MVIKIEIRGNNKVNKRILALPKKLSIALSKDNEQFMRDVAKDAKRYAPRDIGRIRESIKVMKTKTKGKTKQWKLEVGSRHAIFQEEGFKPHFIYTIDGRVNGVGPKSTKFWADGFHWVSKNTPFVRPALEKNLMKFSQRLNNTVRREIKR